MQTHILSLHIVQILSTQYYSRFTYLYNVHEPKLPTFTYHAYMCACVSPRLFHCQKRENIERQELRKHDSVVFNIFFYCAHIARVYVQKNKYKEIMIVFGV